MIHQGSGERAGRPRARLPVAACVAAALALLIAATGAEARTKPCKGASLVPTSAAQLPTIRLATRCLINRERTKRGRKALKLSVPLQKSADWQAQDMLANDYFDHTRTGGPAFADRILRFGYADGAGGYLIGENLAWSSAPGATPKNIVSLWMHSPPHRENILTRDYRDQAISVAWSDGGLAGAYAGSAGPFLVFVDQFGRRY